MNIKNLENPNRHKIIDTMIRAFMQDPLYTWVVPDAVCREKFLKHFMWFRLRYAEVYGWVDVDADGGAVAIWIRPGHDMTPFDLFRFGGVVALLVLDKSSRQKLMRFIKYEEQVKASLIKQPYWYLSPIAVTPELQGRGYGSGLIRKGVEQIKANGGICFLETQSLSNAKLYNHLGFKELYCEKFSDTELQHFCMMI